MVKQSIRVRLYLFHHNFQENVQYPVPLHGELTQLQQILQVIFDIFRFVRVVYMSNPKTVYVISCLYLNFRFVILIK